MCSGVEKVNVLYLDTPLKFQAPTTEAWNQLFWIKKLDKGQSTFYLISWLGIRHGFISNYPISLGTLTTAIHFKYVDLLFQFVCLMNFYHPFYLQFMLFSLKVFVFVLSALYDSYAFFVSRRPGNLYMTLYTLYMALYATYYTSFLIVITRNGSRINSEVSILCLI